MADSPVVIAQINELSNQINELYSGMEAITHVWDPFCKAGAALSDAGLAVHRAMAEPSHKAFSGNAEVVIGELCSGMSALASLQKGLYNVLLAAAPDPTKHANVLQEIKEKREAQIKATEHYVSALDRTVMLPATAPAEKLKAADEDLASKRRTADLHRLDLTHRLSDRRAEAQDEYLKMLESLVRTQLSFYEAGAMKLRQQLPRLEKLLAAQADETLALQKNKELERTQIDAKAERGEADEARKEGFLCRQHEHTNIAKREGWSRCWTVSDGVNVMWWSEGQALAGPPKRSMPLQLCTVKELHPKSKELGERNRFCFALVSAQATAVFQASSAAEYAEWIDTLRAGILNGLASVTKEDSTVSKEGSSPPPGGGGRTGGRSKGDALAADLAHQVATLQRVGGNDVCADCGAAEPTWCSINLGLAICTECSGVHRAMGTHISKVRSMQLDKLQPGVLALLCAMGNDMAASVLGPQLAEAEMPPIAPDAERAAREEYIRAKYELLSSKRHRAITASAKPPPAGSGDGGDGLPSGAAALGLDAEPPPPSSPPKGHVMALCAACEAGELATVLRLLLQEPQAASELDEMHGRTPLHAALLGRQPDVVELLLLNGADPDGADTDGHPPLCRAAVAGVPVPTELIKRSALETKLEAQELAREHEHSAELEATLNKLLQSDEATIRRGSFKAGHVSPGMLSKLALPGGSGGSGGVAEAHHGGPSVGFGPTPIDVSLRDNSDSEEVDEPAPRSAGVAGATDRPASAPVGKGVGGGSGGGGGGGILPGVAAAGGKPTSSKPQPQSSKGRRVGRGGAITDDQALADLRTTFRLPAEEMLLGSSVCTNAQSPPLAGVLSITTSYVCFKPIASTPQPPVDPTHRKPLQRGGQAVGSHMNLFASAINGGSGLVKIALRDVVKVERRRQRKFGSSKGQFTLDITTTSHDPNSAKHLLTMADMPSTVATTHSFRAVMQCDAMQQLLTTSAYLAGASLVGQQRARAATDVSDNRSGGSHHGVGGMSHEHSSAGVAIGTGNNAFFSNTRSQAAWQGSPSSSKSGAGAPSSAPPTEDELRKGSQAIRGEPSVVSAEL